MKETTIKNKHITTYIREFASLSEFYGYIKTTPFNSAFSNKGDRSSIMASEEFAGTKTFEEAVELMKNGWSDEAIKLTHLLKDKAKDTITSTKTRPTYSVQGFQCSVPRYLQGIPDNMINKKNIAVKQKVITINKSITYSSFVSKKTIEEESVKALSLINNIESQGYRCNLNIIFCSEKGNTREMVKVRIKSSGERINVTKLAFPLVHPSMLRRLLLRYIEVAPTTTYHYTWGHGTPTDHTTIKGLFKQLGYENEYVIPAFLPDDINSIETIQNL